jgi:CBS domain containing-hemolysin-like protein
VRKEWAVAEFVIPTVIIIILVLFNGLFVAAEFAIIGVRPTRIAQLAENGDRTAAGIQAILSDPIRQDRYIATAQLGITIASLGLGMYGEHAIADWLLGPFEDWLHLDEATAHAIAAVLALALLTFVHVVVGEMVPKSLALQYAERTVLGIAGSMGLMKRLFYPAVLALNAIGNSILRLLGIPPASGHGRLYSPDELELVVSESHAGGLVSTSEQQLIENIFDFSERRAGQVMTPRPRIIAVPVTVGEAELRARFVESEYSRLPIYERDIDHVVGVILLRDLVRQQIHQPGDFDLPSLIRPLPAIPESMPVDRLLAAFQRSHAHMALVVDEYGGTAGVITLEDLVEEVVGEVRDEFDQNELPPLREVEPGVLVARGDLLLEELIEHAPSVMAERADLPDVETLGGFITALLGRPPQLGDQVVRGGTTYIVEQVDGFAVTQIRIVLATAPHEQGDQAAGSTRGSTHM